MTAKTYRAVKDLNEVIDRIKAHKAYLQKRFKVRTIAVFGSFIRGEQKRGSDVDVLVEFEDLTTKSALRKEITGKVLNEAVYI